MIDSQIGTFCIFGIFFNYLVEKKLKDYKNSKRSKFLKIGLLSGAVYSYYNAYHILNSIP